MTPKAFDLLTLLINAAPHVVPKAELHGRLWPNGVVTDSTLVGLVQEIRRGSFSRSVALPNGLEPDKAQATFENGILRLQIPKAEQVKPRQIRISPVSNGHGEQIADEPAEPQA